MSLLEARTILAAGGKDTNRARQRRQCDAGRTIPGRRPHPPLVLDGAGQPIDRLQQWWWCRKDHRMGVTRLRRGRCLSYLLHTRLNRCDLPEKKLQVCAHEVQTNHDEIDSGTTTPATSRGVVHVYQSSNRPTKETIDSPNGRGFDGPCFCRR